MIEDKQQENTVYSIPITDLYYIHALPDRIKKEVVKNIHDYVEQVKKDYPVKEQVG